MTSHHSFRHWLLLGVLSLCIGCTFLLTKIALQSLSPTTIVFGRLALAAFLFSPLAFLERRKFIQLLPHWRIILLLALTWMAFPFLMSTWGQKALPSATSGVLMAVMPLGVIVLAHFMLPGEQLTRWKAAGFAIGFIGICILMGPAASEAFSGDPKLLVHKLAVLSAALSYSICVVIARQMPAMPRVPLCMATLTCGALMAAPFAFPSAVVDLSSASSSSILALMGVAIIPTMIGFMLNMRLIAEAGASFASYLNYIVPIWATLFGAGLAHESLPASTYLALPIILAGIAISRRKGKAIIAEPAPETTA